MIYADPHEKTHTWSESLHVEKIFYTPFLQKTVQSLTTCLEKQISHMYFISGECGSGKSVALQLLHHHHSSYPSLFLQRPLPSMQEYQAQLRQFLSLEMMPCLTEEAFVEKVQNHLRTTHVVYIDAFELMNYEHMRLTYVLSQKTHLCFVCAIRTSESKKLFNDPRLQLDHKIVFPCKALSKIDIENYLAFLASKNEKMFMDLHGACPSGALFDYTQGNWRKVFILLYAYEKLWHHEARPLKHTQTHLYEWIASIAYEYQWINWQTYHAKRFLHKSVHRISAIEPIFELSLVAGCLGFLIVSHSMTLHAISTKTVPLVPHNNIECVTIPSSHEPFVKNNPTKDTEILFLRVGLVDL